MLVSLLLRLLLIQMEYVEVQKVVNAMKIKSTLSVFFNLSSQIS